MLKNSPVLSSIKKDAHKRKLVAFFCLTVYKGKNNDRPIKAEKPELRRLKSDLGLAMMFSIVGVLLILIAIVFSVSLIVCWSFTRMVISLAIAVWTLLSAATLMSGTGYQLMLWTVTV